MKIICSKLLSMHIKLFLKIYISDDSALCLALRQLSVLQSDTFVPATEASMPSACFKRYRLKVSAFNASSNFLHFFKTSLVTKNLL